MNTYRTSVLCDENIGVESTVIDLIKPSNLTTIGGGTIDNNWLAKMPVGTRFLFRSKQPQNHLGPDIGVQMAEVEVKFKECTQLFDGLNKPIRFLVFNTAFSQQMQCIQELPPFNHEETENVLTIIEPTGNN